jgi:hypothetical protein
VTTPARTTNRPRKIGTATETAVVRFLRDNGWPHAERRSLKGTADQGDITGTPGLVWEVKGGEAARTASDLKIAAWLEETDTERVNAGADAGVLVVQRRRVGAANAGRWWAVVRLGDVLALSDPSTPPALRVTWPVRMYLADVCTLLHAAGYGAPAPEASPATDGQDARD